MSFTKLETNRPEPTSSTTASATSATSRTVAHALARHAGLAGTPAFAERAGETRPRELNAGSRPNRTPVPMAASGGSGQHAKIEAGVGRRGSVAGSDARMISTPQ